MDNESLQKTQPIKHKQNQYWYTYYRR